MSNSMALEDRMHKRSHAVTATIAIACFLGSDPAGGRLERDAPHGEDLTAFAHLLYGSAI